VVSLMVSEWSVCGQCEVNPVVVSPVVSVWSASVVQCGQCGDGHERPAGRAEAMTLERMTDGDVSFDGEAEH